MTLYYAKLRFAGVGQLPLTITQAVVLGRLETNVVDLSPFDADEMGVSRYHCVLIPSERQLAVRDLESTNGTFLNGSPLIAQKPYPLHSNDVLRLGRLEVRIVFSKGTDMATAETARLNDSGIAVHRSDAPPTLPKSPLRRINLQEPALQQAIQILRETTLDRELPDHMALYLADQAVQDSLWKQHPRLAVLRAARDFQFIAQDNADLLREEQQI
jgi:predicted component of type VI protein secretion system